MESLGMWLLGFCCTKYCCTFFFYVYGRLCNLMFSFLPLHYVLKIFFKWELELFMFSLTFSISVLFLRVDLCFYLVSFSFRLKNFLSHFEQCRATDGNSSQLLVVWKIIIFIFWQYVLVGYTQLIVYFSCSPFSILKVLHFLSTCIFFPNRNSVVILI